MEKFILNVLQLIIIVKVGHSLLKWMMYSKKRNKKSITKKAAKLFSNRIHYHLDNALKNQKKKFATTKQKDVAYPSNVVQLRKAK